MSEKPILFSTPMVQAILDGRKTMTRRVVKNKDFQQWVDVGMSDEAMKNPDNNWIDVCPYQSGDILWVRETWCPVEPYTALNIGHKFLYLADNLFPNVYHPWHPSIHMPREAARLFLKVTSVRVERLQDITEQEAIAEGIKTIFEHKPHHDGIIGSAITTNHVGQFSDLWDSLNLKRGYGWGKNPWVWVIEFERVERP